jgi:hypothetical protein
MRIKYKCAVCNCNLKDETIHFINYYECEKCKYKIGFIGEILYFYEQNMLINTEEYKVVSNHNETISMQLLVQDLKDGSKYKYPKYLKYKIIPKIVGNIIDVSIVEKRVRTCLLME